MNEPLREACAATIAAREGAFSRADLDKLDAYQLRELGRFDQEHRRREHEGLTALAAEINLKNGWRALWASLGEVVREERLWHE